MPCLTNCRYYRIKVDLNSACQPEISVSYYYSHLSLAAQARLSQEGGLFESERYKCVVAIFPTDRPFTTLRHVRSLDQGQPVGPGAFHKLRNLRRAEDSPRQSESFIAAERSDLFLPIVSRDKQPPMHLHQTGDLRQESVKVDAMFDRRYAHRHTIVGRWPAGREDTSRAERLRRRERRVRTPDSPRAAGRCVAGCW